jgi:hypothetical protein
LALFLESSKKVVTDAHGVSFRPKAVKSFSASEAPSRITQIIDSEPIVLDSTISMKSKGTYHSDSMETKRLNNPTELKEGRSSGRKKSQQKGYFTAHASRLQNTILSCCHFFSLLLSGPLVKKFYGFYDGLNDTQKSIFINESLPLLQSIKHSVSKLLEYVSFGHPIPTG